MTDFGRRTLAASISPFVATHIDGLSPLTDFGSNLGALNAWTYRPDHLHGDVPLVVVLHGAGQTASDYDRGAGWSRFADRHGFALLFPEQRRANNMMQCFH